MSPSARVASTVHKVVDLPTLPDIYQRVCAVIEQDGSDATARVEQIVIRDPAIMSKLLRVANSALFGFSGEITTVERAVAMLGFQKLKQIVLTTSVLEAFPAMPNLGIDPKQVWEHSFATAIGAENIARRARFERSEEFFVAGLLHDVGILVEMKCHEEEFRQAVKLMRDEGLSLVQAEQRILGQSHDVTGAQLFRHWKLPLHLVTVVGYHHSPHYSLAHRRETAAIALAEMLAKTLDFGEPGQAHDERLADENYRCLALSLQDLDSIAREIEDVMTTTSELLAVSPPRARAAKGSR